MNKNPLVEVALAALAERADGPVVISARHEPENFGDAEALLRIGALLIRMVRDRGQDFVDLAATREPARFFALSDVEVALGWRVNSTQSDAAQDSRAQQLGSLQHHSAELAAAFSEPNYEATIRKVEQHRELRRLSGLVQ